MVKVVNNSAGPVSLGGEAVIEKFSASNVPDEIWNRYKNSVVVRAMLDEGRLSVGGSVDPIEADNSEMDPRMQLIAEIVKEITDTDEMTADGKPKTDAINARMPEGNADVTAMERDRVLELMADAS